MLNAAFFWGKGNFYIRNLILPCIWGALYATLAWSRPFAPTINPFEASRAFEAQYPNFSQIHLENPVTQEAIDMASDDREGRVSDLFHVPEPLKRSVQFWLRIYTQYSSEQVVLYDRLHPEVVYEVLDFQPLRRSAKNAVVYEILREKRIKARAKQFKEAFESLAGHPTRTPVSKEVLQRIQLATRPSPHFRKHSWSEWKKGLRGQTGQRDVVLRGLISAEFFLPKMKEIFTGLEVPWELTALAMVESSFNTEAHSRSGAKGIWQFLSNSGKEFLRVDPANGIDERLSPLKSTIAAARLLKRNYLVTGNWPLAITAYHHGFSGIRKLTKQERNSALDGALFELCQKKRHLGFASSNYYGEFLSILHALAYRDAFFFENKIYSPIQFHYVKLDRETSIENLIRRRNLDEKEFRLVNKDILNWNKGLPANFFVAVPEPIKSSANNLNLFSDELVDSIRPKIAKSFRSPKRRLRN